jgi:hypothetical protein
MVVSELYWWVLHSFGILSVSVLLCPVVSTEDTTPWHSWSKCLKPPFRSFYPKIQHNQQRTPTPWHSWSKCLKRPFRSFYPKVQHKYSQKHYQKIVICKYLTQICSWSTTWRKHEESRVICCNIVHYSTVVPHNFSYIYPWKLKKILEKPWNFISGKEWEPWCVQQLPVIVSFWTVERFL